MISHSFAVMAHRDSPYLTACLDSLKAQTIESKIYITTSTPSGYIEEIAKKYEVETYVSPPNQGIAHDWNFSLQQAKTKYVTLAHQDDLYMPEYTERCVAAAEKFKDTLICFTGYNEIAGQKIRSHNRLLVIKRFMLWSFMPIKKHIKSKTWKNYLLSIGCPIAAPSVMYNLENLNNFQFSNEFSINIDWDAWYRMSGMKGRFVYVTKTLLQHRIHSDSATTSGLKANARQNEDLEMFNRFWPGFIAKRLAGIYAGSYKSNEATD